MIDFEFSHVIFSLHLIIEKHSEDQSIIQSLILLSGTNHLTNSTSFHLQADSLEEMLVGKGISLPRSRRYLLHDQGSPRNRENHLRNGNHEGKPHQSLLCAACIPESQSSAPRYQSATQPPYRLETDLLHHGSPYECDVALPDQQFSASG